MMANVHPLGFTRLSSGKGGDGRASLNIIFVHGLRGHPRGTWSTAATVRNDSSNTPRKHKGLKSLFKQKTALAEEQAPAPSLSPSQVFWPEQYLAPDIPQASVWTYGYNADIIGGLFQANNKNSISQHGQDLAVRLERDIENEEPIVFVVHSLGGIILKDAIRRSEEICKRTKLIVFFGTPHRGSGTVSWALIASNLARLALQDSNKKMLETLEVNNEVLNYIHDSFKKIMSREGIKVHSFQEAQGISGMKGLDEKVVDDFSSKLDYLDKLETVESIDANHMQMVRYSSKDDQGYRAISGILRSFVRRMESPRAPVTGPADVSSSTAPFMVPFPRDNWFVGREDTIAKIGEKRAASLNHTRVALVGLGGVGKSQVAIEYAYRTQQAEPRTLVLWIHASDPARFKQRYREVADQIALPGRDGPKADILKLVYAWLSDRRNGQWLMILDNVDDDNVFFAEDDEGERTLQASKMNGDGVSSRMPLEGFLPQTPNGAILITSRNKTAAINLVGLHGIIAVDPMVEEDALALLKTRVPFDEDEEAEAKALVQVLEHIPLAINHAAAYIKTRAPMTTISTYLELFFTSDDYQVRLLDKKEWKDTRRDYSTRHPVMRTWQISFSQIRKTHRSAADMLALMSMFDKQGIPRSFLQRGGIDQLDFDDALTPLLNFSLVRAEVGNQSFSMHRLVQLSMRTWLKDEQELETWVEESSEVIIAAFSGRITLVDFALLLPHMHEVIGHIKRYRDDSLPQGNLDSKILQWASHAMESSFQMLVDIEQMAHGPGHRDPRALTNVINLVSTMEMQEGYEEAGRKAPELMEKLLWLQHPDTFDGLFNPELALDSPGVYEELEAIYRRVEEGFRNACETRNVDMLFTGLQSLVSSIRRHGKDREAEAMHQRAMEVSKELLEPEHLHASIDE
ncbi:hypothetical protein K504DRAFT_396977 [Pleomassaria siparia CBS 279.74]|uniref:DUF7779 domain-containing protein n=1 Tax=Pleomassaria siparia CBS 279.74 TaxID=1314801 RepID=A0A6G1KT22_9PLEO|nr:hypothetical protein K504DRAFT_396977 [Pleomassaria siparia CBS 279.74]